MTVYNRRCFQVAHNCETHFPYKVSTSILLLSEHGFLFSEPSLREKKEEEDE